MSNNVVSIFDFQKETKVSKKEFDPTSLIGMIIDWAEEHGIDVVNDVGFQIRCSDFMTYLQLAVNEEGRKTA